eukprot:7636715-Alexandrium_andersonii.AAC.1
MDAQWNALALVVPPSHHRVANHGRVVLHELPEFRKGVGTVVQELLPEDLWEVLVQACEKGMWQEDLE